MTDTADWQRKIKAFLYTPPGAVLIPNNEELIARREELSIPSDLDKADAIAWALEKPPGMEEVAVDFASRPNVRHPLSGESKTLWDGSAPDSAAVQSTVNRVIEDLRNEYTDPQQFFFALWRLLPDRLRAAEPTIGRYWDLLPADPRLPDSVWAHAAATSAVATALPRPAFLLFTIASVQEYVAQARRTQDMWAGSFLLSYLTWEAIKPIVESYGPDVIIAPALRGQPLADLWLRAGLLNASDVPEPTKPDLQVANFPNLFSAILPADEAAAAAEEAVKAIQTRRDEIFKEVRAYLETAAKTVHGNGKPDLRTLARDQDWLATWERQQEDFLKADIFWVVLPWDDNPQAAFDRVRAYLPARNSALGTPTQQNETPFEALERVYQAAAQTDPHIGLAYAPLSSWAGRLLTARKNVRHFRQSSAVIGEPGHKCSLCGTREALHPEWKATTEGKRYDELTAFWEALATIEVRGDERRKLVGRIRPGERLCAVCITKRLALEAYFTSELGIDYHMFPSASTVATASFQEAIINTILTGNEGAQALYEKTKAFVQALKPLMAITPRSSSLPKLKRLVDQSNSAPLLQALDGGFKLVEFLGIDGDWFFEESLDAEAIKRAYGVQVNQAILDKARTSLRELLTATSNLGIQKPTSYYAVIYIDGDHMGQWVAGRHNLRFSELLHPDIPGLPPGTPNVLDAPRPMGPGTQAALRTALGNFAVRVARRVVEEQHAGKLIYAGGDDLLAFAPLRDVPGILGELQCHFASDIVEDADRMLLLPGPKASISAGVAVAHRTHPLSQVVEVGHKKALKDDAKKRLGRNAFAFRLMKRSGEALKVGNRWQWPSLDGDVDAMTILNALIGWFREHPAKRLSPRLMRTMAYEAAGLAGLPPGADDSQAAELGRLVRRHTGSQAERDTITAVLTTLLEGYRVLIADRPEELGNQTAWDMTKDFLLLAHFIAKEGANVDRD